MTADFLLVPRPAVSPFAPPEATRLTVGFLPLTDCAPLVAAVVLGLDRRFGLTLELKRQPSWSALAEGLASGALDAAQALYTLPFDMTLGLSGPAVPTSILMGLNRNGQGVTLSSRLAEAGVSDGASLAAHLRRARTRPRFADTYPGGTHALWLRRWLLQHDISPTRDVEILTLPPPAMVDALKAGAIDGFCAGEPWHAVAIAQGAGFTAATSPAVWPDHPEKVLAVREDWLDAHPNAARALIATVLAACRELDALPYKTRLAELLASPDYLDLPAAAIAARLAGDYDDGRGRRWREPHPLLFHDGGAVNPPYWSDARWFLDEWRRWGWLPESVDADALARRVGRFALYAEVADVLGILAPASPWRLAGGPR
ncbi:CmpA/NrtA family ABC transporter substrate-binding protein [Crenobacter luteus]|uniref:Nitrate ABC transporter substrate-binding protein n=1 Tax=Crenobacter luteus TaxID=1452487 RepID=A0A161SGK0_9NEIS|nr:CmpA/NrtA family ABC transporter substrate-binding protein [Crenobacter luteus]KZE32680.1 hypothetical protein AVW16_09820 [Crenobacter luteus]